MKYSKIIATGSFLPQNIVSNFDLEKKIDTSDEWITQRTGIKQRHIIDAQDTTCSMGVAAAKKALKKANLAPEQVGLVIAASCSNEKIFPPVACLIQNELKIPPCPSFDVQAVCSGFMYALSVADKFIKTGSTKYALVIGTEAMSRVLDWNERSTCVLFGDGAGVVLLGSSDAPGILSTHLGADGSGQDILYLNNAKFLDDPYLRMEGKQVFRLAVKWLEEVAELAIKENNLTADDIDWIVPHQANLRIIKSTANKLGIPLEKVIITVDKHANTSAASIPIALDIAIEEGKIVRGNNLLLEAFGGGLTWGSALVRY
jgi:3-oxoacyl-[acyl-carrier-protein] synthase III